MTAKRRGFAVSLRVFRELLGLSREQFGGRIGVAHRTIGRWENGDHEPVGERRGRLVRLVIELGPSAGLGEAQMVDLLGRELAHLAGKGAAGRDSIARGSTASKTRAGGPAPDAAAIEAIVLQVADELDVGPKTLRAGVMKVLSVAATQRLGPQELIQLMAARAKGRKRRARRS